MQTQAREPTSTGTVSSKPITGQVTTGQILPPTATPDNVTANENGRGGLSAGATAGVAIGAVLGVLLGLGIVWAVFTMWKKKRKDAALQRSPSPLKVEQCEVYPGRDVEATQARYELDTGPPRVVELGPREDDSLKYERLNIMYR